MKLTARNRRSNFEVLRLLAIFLIVSFHAAYHNTIYTDFSLNIFAINVFWLFGEIGVNLFLLITGFFQINGHFKFKKIILMYFELIFYESLSYIIYFFVSNDTSFHIMAFFKAIINSDHWYFVVYIITYVFSPLINKLFKSIPKYEFFIFLLTCLLIFSFLPTFWGLIFEPNNTEDFFYFNRLIWAFIVYGIGAFLSMYNIHFFQSPKNNIFLAAICFSIMVISIGVISSVSFFSIDITKFWHHLNNAPIILISISIFNLFSMWNLKPLQLINIISSTTLGIYLFHNGRLYRFIWDNCFSLSNQLNHSAARSVATIIGASLIIIIVGIIIDLIRQIIEKYTIAKILNSPRLNQKCNSLKEHCVKKIQAFIS